MRSRRAEAANGLRFVPAVEKTGRAADRDKIKEWRGPVARRGRTPDVCPVGSASAEPCCGGSASPAAP
ncbi:MULTISPECIES: hypothetical protein [Streptomyces]|uniref:Uncharacterized protein n=1 Tax=Streptomyces fimbriatus TaxID=68197 RepID=A0ABW0D2W3_STRFI